MQKSSNVLIVYAQLFGGGVHIKCTQGKYHDFLKWGVGYQGVTQVFFAATIFHLRLSVKCGWGSWKHSKLWLKQYFKTSINSTIFLAVISGIVNELLHVTSKIFPFLDFMFILQ